MSSVVPAPPMFLGLASVFSRCLPQRRLRANAFVCRLVVCAFALGSTLALAHPFAYSVRSDATNRELYRIDLATGDATLLGPTGVPKIEGLALNRAGELFAVGPSGSQLFKCNTSTGACASVGTLTGVAPTATNAGLAFDATGRLYLAMSAALYSVNPATGATTPIGNMGVAISGLAATTPTAGCPSGLFGLGGNGDQGRFYCLNTTNGAATLLTTFTSIAALDSGLDTDNATGLIWGVTNDNPAKVFSIFPGDLALGNQVTLRVNGTPIGGFESLAVLPTPEAELVASVPMLPHSGFAIFMFLLFSLGALGQLRSSRE